MTAQLAELVNELAIGDAVRHQGLRLIPLRLQRASKLEYLTLDEASEAGLVHIEEVSGGGSVPELRVRNDAKLRVLIVDGTTLVGTKQNRVVNLSIMLAPVSVTAIPVSCVERGRWSTAARRSSPAEQCDKDLRLMMSRGATDSLKKMGAVGVNQDAVWSHVDAMLRDAAAASPTHAYQAVYEKRQRSSVRSSRVKRLDSFSRVSRSLRSRSACSASFFSGGVWPARSLAISTSIV